MTTPYHGRLLSRNQRQHFSVSASSQQAITAVPHKKPANDASTCDQPGPVSGPRQIAFFFSARESRRSGPIPYTRKESALRAHGLRPPAAPPSGAHGHGAACGGGPSPPPSPIARARPAPPRRRCGSTAVRWCSVGAVRRCDVPVALRLVEGARDGDDDGDGESPTAMETVAMMTVHDSYCRGPAGRQGWPLPMRHAPGGRQGCGGRACTSCSRRQYVLRAWAEAAHQLLAVNANSINFGALHE